MVWTMQGFQLAGQQNKYFGNDTKNWRDPLHPKCMLED